MSDSEFALQLRDLACRVAREAGEMVLACQRDELSIDTKASDLDLVTQVDRESEALITERLLAVRPDDGVIGEEGTGVRGSSGVDWLIDPIDGTTSFVYGLPGFSVSIAAQFDAEVIAGVVFAPATGSEYSAARDSGARLNGDEIAVRATSSLDKALVATGFSPELSRRKRQGQLFAELIPRIRDIRRMGSAALDLAAVAAGQVDAYFEVGLSPWDYAAGALIAEEAGAEVVIEPDEQSGRAFVAAVPRSIAPEFLKMLRDLGADRV